MHYTTSVLNFTSGPMHVKYALNVKTWLCNTMVQRVMKYTRIKNKLKGKYTCVYICIILSNTMPFKINQSIIYTHAYIYTYA